MVMAMRAAVAVTDFILAFSRPLQGNAKFMLLLALSLICKTRTSSHADKKTLLESHLC